MHKSSTPFKHHFFPFKPRFKQPEYLYYNKLQFLFKYFFLPSICLSKLNPPKTAINPNALPFPKY